MLTEEEILTRGSLARVNPPLRSQDDVEAVIDGLRDGTIDVIATDHAPHSDAEKALPLTEAPSGISGLETALAAALTVLYHGNKLSLPNLLRKMTYNPARLLRIPKGRLSVGTDGDVVLFHPKETWTVDPAAFTSKGHNTPFAGLTLTGRVKGTVSGGKVVFWEGGRNVD
jgi:dihydroorotase